MADITWGWVSSVSAIVPRHSCIGEAVALVDLGVARWDRMPFRRLAGESA